VTEADGFAAVGKVADLAPGSMTFAAVEGQRIVLANVDGQFYALRDICGHRNAPLSRGKLTGHIVECPLHFAQFDIRNGCFLDGPQSADVPVYEVHVEDGTIYARRK
jgi:nitrite reductase/ring-hydroxylating ferredoxin subunit